MMMRIDGLICSNAGWKTPGCAGICLLPCWRSDDHPLYLAQKRCTQTHVWPWAHQQIFLYRSIQRILTRCGEAWERCVRGDRAPSSGGVSRGDDESDPRVLGCRRRHRTVSHVDRNSTAPTWPTRRGLLLRAQVAALASSENGRIDQSMSGD